MLIKPTGRKVILGDTVNVRPNTSGIITMHIRIPVVEIPIAEVAWETEISQIQENTL